MTESCEVRIQVLKDEIYAIFQAETLYWKACVVSNANARAEHQRRQDLLEELQKELDNIT